jgi:hypothetical protein
MQIALSLFATNLNMKMVCLYFLNTYFRDQ